jgi:uncharacterized protein
MNRMKLSQFNIFIEDYPHEGCYLVYNTFSRALIEIDSIGFSMLNSLDGHKFSALEETTLQKLQKCGIIVDKDEASSFDAILSAHREKVDELHVMVLTTLECPMKCIYCYQGHIEDKKRMSPETTKDVASWIEEQLQRRDAKKCSITYCGGEPLSNLTPIEYIGNRVSKYCQSKGVRLSSAMITSGLLLTPDIADILESIGIKYLQITLDGDKETHDKRRKKRDGSGTFDLIMENLAYLVEHFYVTITCNVDSMNYESAYRLVDIMASKGYADKIKKMFFGPVSAPLKLAKIHGVACPNTNNEDLVSLSIYAAEHGFNPDLRPESMICGMLSQSHLVIDSDGGIYTCPAFLDMEGYRTGSIYQSDNTETNGLGGFELEEECMKCTYLPICSGGCRYNALVEQNNIMAMNCQKEHFSYSLPLLLKAHYSLRHRNVKSPDSN